MPFRTVDKWPRTVILNPAFRGMKDLSDGGFPRRLRFFATLRMTFSKKLCSSSVALRRATFILIIALTLLPRLATAHHISSSASNWKLRPDGASVDFQYPLADIVILVASENVLKGETYIQIVKPVDDALREKMTAFLNREITKNIRLSGCTFSRPLEVSYRGRKIFAHGELDCDQRYFERLRLEDRFLVTLNNLHVSLATIDTGDDRLRCLFRYGLYECRPGAASGLAAEAVPWKDVMGKGDVLAFHVWEQWLFLILLILASANVRTFLLSILAFFAGNLAGMLPMFVERLPEPSLVKPLVPMALIIGALMSIAAKGWWNRWAWWLFWFGNGFLLLLSAAGIFTVPVAATAGMALVGYGVLRMASQREVEPSVSGSAYIFAALFGILHGFALGHGLRNYSTFGAGGMIAAIGFDPGSEGWIYIGIAALLPLVALSRARVKFAWWTASLSAMAATMGLYWLVSRGITLPDIGMNYKDSVESLKEMIQSPNLAFQVVLVALIVAVILGALHAITPGHGKTVVAAYLVGSKGRVRDAIILGFVVTITHTSSVLVLGVIALVASKTILPGDLTPYLGTLSGIIIVVMGAVMLAVRYRNWKRTGEAVVAHQHHTHGHDHDHDHAKEGQARGVRFFNLVALGVSGGMVPCPDAFIVLLIAVAVNRIALGVVIIIAFSAGLAAVLIAIGIMMVKAAPLFERFGGDGKFVRAMPMISAILVTLIGIAITYQSLSKVL